MSGESMKPTGDADDQWNYTGPKGRIFLLPISYQKFMLACIKRELSCIYIVNLSCYCEYFKLGCLAGGNCHTSSFTG